MERKMRCTNNARVRYFFIFFFFYCLYKSRGMFLRPFCSSSLACAKFPGARLRRLPDERPSSRIPFLVNHPVHARDSPPTRSRRQKRFVQRKIFYIKYIYLYFLFYFFQGAAALYEIGSNVSYYYYTTGFVSTSCYAILTLHATLQLYAARHYTNSQCRRLYIQ